MKRPGNQSPEHHALVIHAVAWLYRRGYRVIEPELEIGKYRCDVIGVEAGRRPRIAVVEVKAHRGDWLAERRIDARALEAGEALPRLKCEADLLEQRYQDAITAQLPRNERKARREAADVATAAIARAQRDAYERVGIFDRALRTSKFTDPALLSATTERYLIAPLGVVVPDELPAAWGLVDESPRLVRRCPVAGEVKASTVEQLLYRVGRRVTWARVHTLPGEWRDHNPFPLAYPDLVEAVR